MIGQYLLNTNENVTVHILQKNLEVNKTQNQAGKPGPRVVIGRTSSVLKKSVVVGFYAISLTRFIENIYNIYISK